MNTYSLKVTPEIFRKLLKGSKTVDLRVGDEPQRICPGDTVIFESGHDALRKRAVRLHLCLSWADFKVFGDLEGTGFEVGRGRGRSPWLLQREAGQGAVHCAVSGGLMLGAPRV